MAASARGFVNGNCGDLGQVSRGHGQVDITVANRLHPMPRQVHYARHRGKCHLPTQRQHKRFKEKREAVQLTDPVGLGQPHRAVRQSYPQYPDLQIAFVLEKIQVPQPLDLGVVNRMPASYAGIGKARTRDKVHSNDQFTPCGVEVDALHVPRCLDSQGGFKQLGLAHRFSLSRRAGCSIPPQPALSQPASSMRVKYSLRRARART